MSFYKFLLGSVPLIGIITIFIVGWYITLTYDDGYFWINVIFMGAFTYIIFTMFSNLIKDINSKKDEQPRNSSTEDKS